MALTGALQPSFEDLATPLFDVTFAVLDLETTGLSPVDDRITEVGVVKVQAGDVLGEFATLVDPGCTIPPAITAVTGITDHMVASRPPIEAVLPALVEFLRGTVLVAHNAAFDTRFLAATLQRHAYPPLALPVVDTAAVARRLLRDEVRNCRLATLARHVRSPTTPEHRALPDARATVDVLHHLIERAGTLGATTLEDLQEYARSSSDRAFRKLGLVRDAPSAPGVYRFLDVRGEVLYVGTTGDLRSRLRRYFGGDRRRRIADLVRETDHVTWTVTPTALEAGVRELRQIRAHRPRYNRRSRDPQRRVHVKLTTEAFPRLSVVRDVRDDGATYLVGVGTRRTADALIDAVHDVATIRRCTTRLRLAQDHPTCILKDIGRCASPCDGTADRASYGEVTGEVRDWLATDPTPLLARLRDRMHVQADAGRYEAAAVARGRLHLVARTLVRARRLAWIGRVDELILLRPGRPDEAVRAVRGRLTASLVADGAPADEIVTRLRAASHDTHVAPGPPTVAEHEEVELLLGWIDEARPVPLAVDGVAAQSVDGGHALADALAESRRLARRLRSDRLLLGDARVAQVRSA